MRLSLQTLGTYRYFIQEWFIVQNHFKDTLTISLSLIAKQNGDFDEIYRLFYSLYTA